MIVNYFKEFSKTHKRIKKDKQLQDGVKENPKNKGLKKKTSTV